MKRKNYSNIRTIWIILSSLIFVVLIIWNNNLTAVTKEIGRDRAEPIIHALSEYNDQYGTYVYRLSQLTPNQLGKIPTPGLFHKFCYESLNDGGAYQIGFAIFGTTDDWYIYKSDQRAWKTVDSGGNIICSID